MKYTAIRYILFALALLACAGCAGQATPTQPAAAAPSPTIASQAIQAAPTAPPSPAVQLPAATPTASTGQPTAVPQASAEASIYLWPTYLPAGIRVSPAESRVSSSNQVGPTGLGFYIVTLNGSNQKLSIGGGDIQDVLPLIGDERSVTAGKRLGKLITNGERREIIFDEARGKLYIYSSGLSEDELLKVAESLQPIDVQDLRGMVNSS